MEKGKQEKRLWGAVMLQAIVDSRKKGLKVHQNSAIRWIKNTDDHPGTFNWVCSYVLDFDPEKTRKKILQ